MSIASEITRIRSARDSIVSALSDAGIHITGGTLSSLAQGIIDATGVGTPPGNPPTITEVPAGVHCALPLYQRYSDINFHTNALKTVLAENGVTIPTGTRIDGLAELIRSDLSYFYSGSEDPAPPNKDY